MKCKDNRPCTETYTDNLKPDPRRQHIYNGQSARVFESAREFFLLVSEVLRNFPAYEKEKYRVYEIYSFTKISRITVYSFRSCQD